MLIVTRPLSRSILCITRRICHVSSVTSRRAIESGARVQLSQCPQGVSADASAVLQDEIESEDEAEKYLVGC